jgi:hypothetical protein
MKTVLSNEQKDKLINRACPGFTAEEKVKLNFAWCETLEEALIKALVKNSAQRKELRRLNEQVKHINALVDQNKYLIGEVQSLEELLERDEAENRLTDPSELVPDEVTQVETPVAKRASVVPAKADELYDDWDMRVRYPALQSRSISR